MLPEFDAVLRDNLGLDPGETLEPGAPLTDYGLDSLTAVNIVADLEERFAVTFPDEQIMHATFSSAETLWRVVSALRDESRSEVR